MKRVDEALRRWAEHKSRVDEASSPYWSGTFSQDDEAHKQLANDLRCFADEYAKLRDDTEITEEWAEKVRSEPVHLHNLEDDTGRHSWRLSIDMVNTVTGLIYMTTMYVTTRGQVRCLLLAAGIECEV